jgi:probable phosphoglycerate mutase
MHLLLLRHGETDWNSAGRIQGHTDTPLNARGVEQAEQLAARVAAEGRIDALYTSPLARAHMTAEIIARRITHTPLCDDRLKEKSLGELDGMTMLDFQQRYPDLYARWQVSQEHVPLPGEETPPEFARRVQTFLDDVRARHANGARVVIVAHGGTIGMVIATLIGLDINRRLPFWFDNASVSLMDLGGSRPRLRLLNDTCHLRNGCQQQMSK